MAAIPLLIALATSPRTACAADDAGAQCDAPAGALEGPFAAGDDPATSVLSYELRNGLVARSAALGGPAAQFDVRGSAPTGTHERGSVFSYDFVWQRASEFDRGYAGAGVQFGTYGDGMKTGHSMVHPAVANAEWTRLESWVQLDEPDSRRVVRLGDAVTRPGATGRARRFAGVQWGTHRGSDAAADARFMPQVLPGDRASSEVPRTLDVLVSQARDRAVPLNAGPDQLRRLPVVRGAGDVLLVTTDLLGRAQWLSVPFFVSPGLLPAGASSYSASLGFERLAYGHASNEYGAPLAQAYWRQGLSSNLTGEVRMEGDPDSNALAASGSSAVGRLGVLTVNAAQLREATQTYAAYGASFDHRAGSLGLAAGASWRDPLDGTVTVDRNAALPPRREFLARASYDLSGVALAAGGLLREHDDATRDSLWSASVATRFLDDGTLALSAVHARLGTPTTSVVVSVSLPLGPRASASPPTSTLSGRMDLLPRSDGPGASPHGGH